MCCDVPLRHLFLVLRLTLNFLFLSESLFPIIINFCDQLMFLLVEPVKRKQLTRRHRQTHTKSILRGFLHRTCTIGFFGVDRDEESFFSLILFLNDDVGGCGTLLYCRRRAPNLLIQLDFSLRKQRRRFSKPRVSFRPLVCTGLLFIDTASFSESVLL